MDWVGDWWGGGIVEMGGVICRRTAVQSVDRQVLPSLQYG